jgi:Transposase DDE domain
MNTHDSTALEPALAEVSGRGIRPQVLLADSHYGSTDNLQKAAGQTVELVAPALPPKGSKQEKRTLEHVELNEDGWIRRCPEGHTPVTGSMGSDKLQVLFAPTACAACPRQKGGCASAVGRKEKRYQDTQDRVRQRARRLQDQTPGFGERYRWRAGIEGTLARYKRQMGMARLRVRGLKAVRYTAFLRALGLNIHRVAVWAAN